MPFTVVRTLAMEHMDGIMVMPEQDVSNLVTAVASKIACARDCHPKARLLHGNLPLQLRAVHLDGRLRVLASKDGRIRCGLRACAHRSAAVRRRAAMETLASAR
jgi:hypothetical protein